ncbi:MAG: hypothetical protein ACRYGK_12520 [Janthinobacterium lividum]
MEKKLRQAPNTLFSQARSPILKRMMMPRLRQRAATNNDREVSKPAWRNQMKAG